MTPRLLLIPAAVAAALALPATASANNPTASADCSGFSFDMPAGIAGTTVVVLVNDRVAFTDIIEVQGESSSFHLPSDGTTRRWYLVDVVAPYANPDHRFVFDVPACVTPTTPSPTTTVAPSTTVPPVPTTSSTVAPSTTVPPVGSSTTVVTTPRTTVTPTTTQPAFVLPETGRDVTSPLIAGVVALVLGFGAIFGGRRWAS